jgi:RNA polymerase sigma-70 factor (ECF subfamily)
MLSARKIPAEEALDPDSSGASPTAKVPDFETLYETYLEFIWRSARRLGVADDAVDDVVQHVFLVVHRRLPELQHTLGLRSWLFGILVRVVREYRRSLRRKSPHVLAPANDPEEIVDLLGVGPDESMAQKQAARLVQTWLEELDDEKREVFVLAELEQMTAREIADVTGVNESTVYSRLRAARQDFERAAERYRRRDTWRVG